MQKNSKPVQSENPKQFQLLVEAVIDYAIYMIDLNGQIKTWNLGAERIKGYKATEIIGQNFEKFFTPEDVKIGKPKLILEHAAKHGRTESEGWRVRKNGTRFWVNAIVTALRDESGNLIGFTKVTRDLTEKRRHEEALEREIAEKRRTQRELEKSEASLRELSVSLLRTQDEERKRIGREMHDSLGQYLSALKLKLGMFRVLQPQQTPEASAGLAEAQKMLDECIREVRTISYLLYPPMLEELGLTTAVPWYLEGFGDRSGLDVRFNISENFGRIARDHELAIFRVLQESLTNVHKHSGSKIVDVDIERSNGTVTLLVRDYGRGLPESVFKGLPESTLRLKGLGLRGMKERMQQLNGTLDLENAKPGTTVRASLPVIDTANEI